mmetsp:Transcript_15670/g.37760  ORF Transcript_15670/g.37760 Transcript_15670/m.37760 type:complete len:347 (-) Transcript_15670:1641-2681(-)
MPVLCSGIGHEPPHEDTDSCKPDVQADHHVPNESPWSDELVVRSARRLDHDIQVRRVESQGGGREPIGDQINPEQLHWNQSLWNSQRGGEKDTGDLSDVGGNQIANESLHIRIDRSTLFHCRHDCAEIVIGQHHVRCHLGHLCPGDTHSHSDSRLSEGGGVVYSIPRHGRDLAQAAQQTYNRLLVGRLSAREHRTGGVPEDIHLLLLAESSKLGARQGLLGQIVAVLDDSKRLGDSLSGVLVVTGDHDDCNPCLATSANGVLALRPRRIADPYQAQEGHLGFNFHRVLGILEHLVGLVPWSVVIRQLSVNGFVSQSQGPQSPATHLVHLLQHPRLGSFVQGLSRAV